MIEITLLAAVICAAIILKFIYSAYTMMKQRKEDALERMDTLYDVDADKPVKLHLALQGRRAA